MRQLVAPLPNPLPMGEGTLPCGNWRPLSLTLSQRARGLSTPCSYRICPAMPSARGPLSRTGVTRFIRSAGPVAVTRM